MTVGVPDTGTAADVQERAAIAELLLSLADDEFVIGYWDSEWTGIAPFLEEDVAISSLAQDELGHARAFYELLAELIGGSADTIAYGRQPDDYRHARLLDRRRTDWAFTIARRYLYETSDSIRLAALEHTTFEPLAGLVAKIRREERYHLMHLDLWLRRLAVPGSVGRARLEAALATLWAVAGSVFSPLEREADLLRAGVLDAPFSELFSRWCAAVGPVFDELGLPFEPRQPARDGRGPGHGPDFQWLWTELSSVYRSDPGATW